ncbi:phospholipase D-like domain-containing protein [uncultured Sphingomonas sp.]|uniref:phospholipase D-like domain-containing protein n=1 Tax=uncultured Sphingomonas sp. TaxID=158754 RepID=UPI0035CA0114
MRILDAASRAKVQQAIDQNHAELAQTEGFVSAEPGFPIVDGAILREPAVIVFVRHRKPADSLLAEDRAPRQIGSYRVCVLQADPMQQIAATDGLPDVMAMVEASVDNLTYEPIDDNPIDTLFEVKGSFLCHVGPDAGWPTLKPFLEGTRHSLSVAMYDFNADYIAKTFIDTVRGNDITAVLTWDDGMTAPETAIRTKLRSSLQGLLDGWIVQCGGGRRFASAYHEKVAVRDAASFWLSSGNWSLRSQPNIDPIGFPAQARGMYSKGNREWHVIVDDADLAQLFERYIRHDRDGSEQEKREGDAGAQLDVETPVRLPDVFVPIDRLVDLPDLAAAPDPVAPRSLPSTARAIKVQPVLTPDNYLGKIMDLLKGARKSIYLQYAYITYSAAIQDKRFTEMLELLGTLSYRHDLDVRIIVGSTDAANKVRKLVESGYRDTVFRIQGNIHNKGIIVDGEIVLVSSANWSGDGVLRNRDAGLILYDAEIADYYRSVFLDDWDNRARANLDEDKPVLVAGEGEAPPAGMVRMSWRDYYG